MRPGFFRFTLAALVVVAHTTNYLFGTFAVLTFFILSGYVITLAWERRYSQMTYAPFVFIISRFWRLYPAFAISIAFAASVQGISVSLGSLSLFGALSNKINPPVWSLDFEAQFYLIVPLIVPVIIGGVTAAYATAAMVVFFILVFIPVTNTPFLGLLPFFMVGVILARLNQRIDGRVAATSLGAALALVGLSYLYEPTQHVFFKQYTDQATFRHLMWGSAALAFVSAPFALWTAQRRGGRIDNVFGGLSYTLYLVHWTVVMPNSLVTAWFWPRVQAHFSFMTETLVVWILCIIAALGLLALEAPSEWARQRVIYRRRAHHH